MYTVIHSGFEHKFKQLDVKIWGFLLNNFDFFFTEYPEFIKTPNNVTVKVGTTARFDCSAKGEPKPKIVWNKNGGNFLAANENRFHVMTADDVFFIAQVKPEDEGVYRCTASNSEGQISINVTLTVQRE